MIVGQMTGTEEAVTELIRKDFNRLKTEVLAPSERKAIADNIAEMNQLRGRLELDRIKDHCAEVGT